jgi:hypothetical protein
MMTRQLHDQLAKEYLEELLKPLGNVTISKDVKSEVQEIDVSFEPTTTLPKNSEVGLLGRMAVTSCLFEPYRNAPNEVEIRSCLLKLYSVQGELLRQAKREKRSKYLSKINLTFLEKRKISVFLICSLFPVPCSLSKI